MSSNHPLITPQFSGTSDDVVNSLTYWSGLASCLRSLKTSVTNVDNQALIIDALCRELDVMRAEVTNPSAELHKSNADNITLTQPVVGNDELSDKAVPSPAPAPGNYARPTTGLLSSLVNAHSAAFV